MTQSTIELYLYMGSHEPIIEWLKSEGVKTRQQAIDRLSPYVSNIATSSIILGGSLAGAANGSKEILNAFPEK